MRDKLMIKDIQDRINRIHRKRGLYVQYFLSMTCNDLDAGLISEVFHQIHICDEQIAVFNNFLNKNNPKDQLET